MYPTISTGTKKVDLAGDDVEGIQVLYGSNPNYNGSTTATTTRRPGEREMEKEEMAAAVEEGEGVERREVRKRRRERGKERRGADVAPKFA
ncbi:hypothetical protein Vadar_021231 [Vaccinium darrowii]|uniref:Uncharacterized protein n=1 Tax=Vaccinium darrowii TaxID=229202 RepID=A0ACB7ZLX2_9ERIC|nr:hypothetical protein Vadar_021231 [Vaccinium darrowii]